ncbi:hypothetical protein [Pseudonocardia acidicola]|uniref:Uncharacterized protein n=1 Tax=Pseudonocardia acidicola TaxID=2724939 RepID=A0ABX1S6U6_9PSEU|nr:hypothetical protein [Pseudonocardia acidicola]NMH96532.1 hypothetical protein [Pseudonocardia acidicola]
MASDEKQQPQSESAAARLPLSPRSLLSLVVGIVAIIVLVPALTMGRGPGPAAPGSGSGTTIAITAVSTSPSVAGERLLRVRGTLTGRRAQAPETYIYVVARPTDGTPVEPTAPAPGRASVSRGTVRIGDGTWETEIRIAAAETRELTLQALAGVLCPSSPAAPCQVDDRAVVHDLAAGTDTRAWDARSPGFTYRPA